MGVYYLSMSLVGMLLSAIMACVAEHQNREKWSLFFGTLSVLSGILMILIIILIGG